MMLGLAGCGGSAAPAATTVTASVAPEPVVLRAPRCTFDPMWTVERAFGAPAKFAAVRGAPAFVNIDTATHELEIEDVEKRQLIARVKIPIAEGLTLFPFEALNTAEGTLVLVGAATARDAAMSSDYDFFVVRFNATGEPSVVKLELSLKNTYTASMIAVGDHVVVAAERNDNIGSNDVQMFVGMFDRSGKLVHDLDEPSTTSLVALGPTTFAVQARAGSGRSMVRVFDTKRRAWVGPAVPLTNELADWIPMDGRALLVAFDTSGREEETTTHKVSLAALDATGALSAWQPLGIEADTVRLAARPDGSTLLLAGNDIDLQVMAVAPDLRVESGAAIPSPDPGFGFTPVVSGDSLYLATMRLVERYRCR